MFSSCPCRAQHYFSTIIEQASLKKSLILTGFFICVDEWIQMGNQISNARQEINCFGCSKTIYNYIQSLKRNKYFCCAYALLAQLRNFYIKHLASQFSYMLVRT